MITSFLHQHKPDNNNNDNSAYFMTPKAHHHLKLNKLNSTKRHG